ncbi:helix-turn-helix domain-containing protein [Endozoicomonas lisbonensis]|uniref:IS30 family transposase n=1 Tax=Endozoicomonas lisbonensis TaxID=3120522 RepID=A0ABV2SG48_9GAMM
MSYTQLTEHDRITIWSLKREGKSQAEIARRLGCHRSTISRELKRNHTQSGYDAHTAHQLAEERRRHHKSAVTPDPGNLLGILNTLGWSKEKQKAFILRHHPELRQAVEQMPGC